MSPVSVRRADRPALTVRLAMLSARRPLLTLGAWFAFMVGLLLASLALGGIKTAAVTTSGVSGTEADRAAAAMQSGQSAEAGTVEEIDVVVTGRSQAASDPAFRSQVEAMVARLGAVTAAVDGRTLPAIDGLTDPYQAPPTAGLIAPDGTSVRIVGSLSGDPAELEARAKAIGPVVADLQSSYPALEIHALDNTLTTDEVTAEINADMDGTMAVSMPATFLILLLAFGALVAAGVPLILAVTVLLGGFGIFGIISQTVEPVSPFAAQFIVLIGLAVSVDYSLFILSRFRTERRAGRERLAAIEIASATSGRATLFSGLAVMISLGGLFLMPDSLFQSIAIGTIGVIAVSVVGSLTFLPAVLALLGDGIDRGRLALPRRLTGRLGRASAAGESGPGVWERLVGVVMRHPVPAALASVVVLLALAAPTTGLRLGSADMSAFPDRLDGVRAYEMLQTHWSAGSILHLDMVLVENHGPDGARIAAVEKGLLAVQGLSGPATVTTSPDGRATAVSVVLAGGTNDPASWDVVRSVRADVAPAVRAANPDATVYVGGDAAAAMDETAVYADGMVRIVCFVLLLSFGLLLLVFHSIAIPLKAIVLNLLATGAAFGTLVVVFQDGLLAAPFGIRPIEAIQNFIPFFVFTMLFGLSMDYEVLILSRVAEAHDHGHDSREAVAVGIGRTAATVTSAAAIMVVVFLVFVGLPLAIARELGLGLAVAVLVDATVIRTVLLPATMRLLGDWNWWLPSILRWLPRIRIEGEPAAEPDHKSSGALAEAR